jgi:hypothetical protein
MRSREQADGTKPAHRDPLASRPSSGAFCAACATRQIRGMDYESDLHAWTKEQADALRRRAANELDWDNLAEEIQSLGAGNLDQLESRLENLILHLLKWKYQRNGSAGAGAARFSKPGIASRG